MNTIRLGDSDLESSRLAYGCMRIAGDGSSDDRNKGKRAIHAAVEAGYTLFDHADIYGRGACEELFGEVVRDTPGLCERIVIASKCGIRFAGDPDSDAPARYDFSEDHIVQSVEGSLQRLGIERLDLLMLHRPDFLMRPGEVAEALASLQSSGKVAHFGVSNFSTSQFDLLQSVLPEPLLVNQVEINLHNVDALTSGVLDQCQQNGITPQAWSPLAGIVHPAWSNTFSSADEERIRAEVERQCNEYGVDGANIALAWLLRHPACISPIIGSTNPARIAGAAAALDVAYSRDDWYRLLEARNGAPVP